MKISFGAFVGLSFIDEFDLFTLGMFRSGWKDRPRSSAKKLERMRAFFRIGQSEIGFPIMLRLN
jgi:hypothetical protein